MLVYLFGPIHNKATDDAQQWRRIAADLVTANTPVITFDPWGAFKHSNREAVYGPGGQRIVTIDEHAVKQADALLGILDPTSVGSVREVEMAVNRGTPVFAVLHSVESKLPPHLADDRIHRFGDIRDAADACSSYLREVSFERPTPLHTADEIRFLPDEGNAHTDVIRLPEIAHHGDAGFDVAVPKDVTIKSGETVDIPLGLRMQLPPNTWATVVGRSSTFLHKHLMVHQSVIDNGYRGPLFVLAQNLSLEPIEFKQGDRIAQIVLYPLITPTPKWVSELSTTERGTSGFGSTGS